MGSASCRAVVEVGPPGVLSRGGACHAGHCVQAVVACAPLVLVTPLALVVRLFWVVRPRVCELYVHAHTHARTLPFTCTPALPSYTMQQRWAHACVVQAPRLPGAAGAGYAAAQLAVDGA